MENFFADETLLDQFQVPAFTVVDGRICRLNRAAQQHLLCTDTPVDSLLGHYADAYRDLENGSVCVPLQLNGRIVDFCIYKAGGLGYFVAIRKVSDDLRGMALAAGVIRASLSNLSALSDTLCEEQHHLATEANREVHRLSRLACNMADAAAPESSIVLGMINISAVIAEVFDKAASLLKTAGITLYYRSIRKAVHGLADPVSLERAILNLLSNSAKFAPNGSIYADLSQHDKYLYLTVSDTGEGIDPKLLPTVFSRYSRESAVEDCRHGVGLGMHIAYNIARAHGGSLFVESGTETGSRITLTLCVRRASAEPLVSALFVPDYAGGRDHALQELSDVLPACLYE